jgi:hypothetical protein
MCEPLSQGRLANLVLQASSKFSNGGLEACPKIPRLLWPIRGPIHQENSNFAWRLYVVQDFKNLVTKRIYTAARLPFRGTIRTTGRAPNKIRFGPPSRLKQTALCLGARFSRSIYRPGSHLLPCLAVFRPDEISQISIEGRKGEHCSSATKK